MTSSMTRDKRQLRLAAVPGVILAALALAGYVLVVRGVVHAHNYFLHGGPIGGLPNHYASYSSDWWLGIPLLAFVLLALSVSAAVGRRDDSVRGSAGLAAGAAVLSIVVTLVLMVKQFCMNTSDVCEGQVDDVANGFWKIALLLFFLVAVGSPVWAAVWQKMADRRSTASASDSNQPQPPSPPEGKPQFIYPYPSERVRTTPWGSFGRSTLAALSVVLALPLGNLGLREWGTLNRAVTYQVDGSITALKCNSTFLNYMQQVDVYDENKTLIGRAFADPPGKTSARSRICHLTFHVLVPRAQIYQFDVIYLGSRSYTFSHMQARHWKQDIAVTGTS